ncbi:hypothetical protein EXE59_11465 [Nocardioides eburneiflavus]|uniref:Uncharacterized protein n=1 Tax=Nocardioides eburneiflavus TaxID=2518372 RepID=A0A4Z1C5H3_9ACTN|nr:hypothetical protein EXE59_11465 [Nocardioides eburneiflavus]
MCLHLPDGHDGGAGRVPGVGLMAHKKRVQCCRSTPRCAACPVVALQAKREAARGSKKRGARKRRR